MSSTHKLYPRNNLYTTGQSHISNHISNNTHNNIRSSSENQHTTHNKAILQIEQLYLRIQRLQSEMSSVMEDVEATFGLQDNSQLNIENEELKQTLIKNQQITKDLKQKLSQLESQNGQLRSNIQTQELQIEKIKSANKAHVKNLSQQIANYKSNREMVDKQSIEKAAQIDQLAKMVLKYEKQVECLTEEIQLFKSEIQQNSIISNQKINLFQQEIQIQRQQIQELTNNSQPSQKHKEVVKIIENLNLQSTNEPDSNVLINLKNAKIKSLQNNINYMQEQIRGKQKQLASLKNINMKLQKQANANQHLKQERNLKLYEQQLKEMENKINDKSTFHKQQLKQIERKYEQKINSLQSQLTSCKRFQNQVKILEQSNRCLKQQATVKELQIYELEQKIRNLKRKQHKLKGIEDQVEEMKRYEQEQQKRYSSAQKNKYKVTQQLEQLRNSHSHIQKQLQATQRHKQNVILELQHLTQQYHQLKQEQNEYRQQQQFHNIKLEQEKQSKWEQASSRLQNSLKQIETLQQINKQLESLLNNEKVMKQSQINKYKSILNDYKTLNQELTKELAQYRNNQPIDQILNFQKDQLPIKNLLPQFSDHSQNQPKFSTNKPTLVSSNQSKMGKQEQFAMVQNTSLRSQIVELSIRIQEYRGTIDALEDRLKHNNVQSIKIALKKEYEGKMEIQRMEIINEYNILLRERQVRVQHKDSPCTHGHFEQNIKHHPQYKALQQEYLILQKEILEIEHKTYKTNTQYKDEIQKLRIQNEFHRKNIDHLHSQSYKITPNYQHQLYPSDIKLTKLNQEISITHPTKQPFSFTQKNSHASNENVELQNLRKVVDHTIYLLGLTSSSPSSTINRSIWIIQEMEELVKLLRQDLQIIKTQKKQTSIKNKALNLQIQLLEEENRNLSRQLSMSREKQKYLQNKSLKLSIQSQVGLKNQLKTDKIGMQNLPHTAKYHKMNEVHQAQWVTHNLNYDSLPNS